MNPDDALGLVAVHAELLELLREDLRVLDPLARGDFSGPDCLDDLGLERLGLHVEPVVLVWRFAFERTALAADTFAVHDDRRARRFRHLVGVLAACGRRHQWGVSDRAAPGVA